MKKYLSFFTVTATLIGFASCSQNEITEPTVDTDKPVEIRVAGKALSITPQTRAPHTGTSANGLTARVLASKISKEYAGADLVTNGTITFEDASTGSATGYSPAVPYPHAVNPVYLLGLYPTLSSADWTIAADGKSANFTFDGSHDVMATQEISTTRADGVTGGTYKSLTFHHLLTKLDLLIKADDQSAIEAWGNVTSITVKSSKTAKVTFSDATAATAPTTGFTENADFPFYQVSDNAAFASVVLTTSATDAQYYALVAPNETGPATYDLVIKTANYPTDYAITVPLESTPTTPFTGSTQGKQFKITLTFTATDIKAFATVVDWTTGGTGGGTIQ